MNYQDNELLPQTSQKKTVILNRKIVNTVIMTFLLSSIMLLTIDFFYSEKSGTFFHEEKAYIEYGNSKHDVTLRFYGNVSIQTPFGGYIRVEGVYADAEDLSIYRGFYYGKGKILNDVIPNNIFICYIHDIWVVFLITILMTLIVYIKSKCSLKVQ